MARSHHNVLVFIWDNSWWIILLDIFFATALGLSLLFDSSLVKKRLRYPFAGQIILLALATVETLVIWTIWACIEHATHGLRGDAKTSIIELRRWLGPVTISIMAAGVLGMVGRLIPWRGLNKPARSLARRDNYSPRAWICIAVILTNITWALTVPYADLRRGQKLFDGDDAYSMVRFANMMENAATLSILALLASILSLFAWVEAILQLHVIRQEERETKETSPSGSDIELGNRQAPASIGFTHSNGRSTTDVTRASSPTSTWVGRVRLPTPPLDEARPSTREILYVPSRTDVPRIELTPDGHDVDGAADSELGDRRWRRLTHPSKGPWQSVFTEDRKGLGRFISADAV
ncbi:MAG: hypothetical protein M1817_000888 [Caeruleum heppii]|nr:MAG: hypothetical protein M1817_000888 [Caeruleum heppii]